MGPEDADVRCGDLVLSLQRMEGSVGWCQERQCTKLLAAVPTWALSGCTLSGSMDGTVCLCFPDATFLLWHVQPGDNHARNPENDAPLCHGLGLEAPHTLMFSEVKTGWRWSLKV